MKRFLLVVSLSGLAAYGQPWGNSRRADIRGGGGPGKCTIEVVVDGTAEVEINQTNGRLRTLSGQPAQWRRFECNQPLPPNPVNFRFRGIDGRGRQELVSDPGRGGVAVVRITDSQGGAEGYTFDIEWGGGGGGYGGDRPSDRPLDRGPERVPDRGVGPDRAYSPLHGDWVPEGRWTGARGSTLRFQGDGRGFFNRQNGRDMVVRDVMVTVNREGRVVVEFEAQGFRRLVFTGQP